MRRRHTRRITLPKRPDRRNRTIRALHFNRLVYVKSQRVRDFLDIERMTVHEQTGQNSAKDQYLVVPELAPLAAAQVNSEGQR